MKSNHAAFYFATSEEAESAFYSAFEMGDDKLMDDVLAEQGVSCIHPGSLPIIGRGAVLDSWIRILTNIDTPAFYTELISSTVVDDIAVHLVIERIAADHHPDSKTSLVLATNVYIRQKNGWRLQMHHASLPPEHQDGLMSSEPDITHEAPHTLQ